MGVVTSIPFSNVLSTISSQTIFKDCSVPFEDRLSNLPGNGTRLFGFETQLGKRARDPDIALCFSKEDFSILADWCESNSLDSVNETYWSRIRDIAKGKGNYLKEHLNATWLEIDRSTNSTSRLQEPGFFIELLQKKSDPEFVCSYAIPVLTGIKNHPSLPKVHSCLGSIPSSGELVHLGYFPSRSVDKLRLTISFNHYHDIAPYCSRIFRKGLNKEIQNRIKELSELSEYAVLHLDIGAEIDTRLGMEIRFHQDEQNLEFQWRWRNVFSKLMNLGLCSSEEAKSILGFSGITRFIDDSTFAPSWYRHFLYYIKGVFDVSGQEHYKAYCAIKRLEAN